MKKDISTPNIIGNAGAILRRFQTLLFFLLVSAGLFVAIVALLSTINLSSTTATSSEQSLNASFDEETIQRLKQGSSKQITPGARQSPFVE
jgi:uncharacterized membrane protein